MCLGLTFVCWWMPRVIQAWNRRGIPFETIDTRMSIGGVHGLISSESLLMCTIESTIFPLALGAGGGIALLGLFLAGTGSVEGRFDLRKALSSRTFYLKLASCRCTYAALYIGASSVIPLNISGLAMLHFPTSMNRVLKRRCLLT